MGVYPMWMNRRGCKPITIEIPVPGNGGSGGGGSGGGGGAVIPIKQPLPKVRIKKVIVMDEYEHMNVTVLQVIDLSLNGGI